MSNVSPKVGTTERKPTESFARTDDDYLRRLLWRDVNQHISWKRYEHGCAEVKFEMHKRASWLQINSQEGYETDGGKFINKEVYVCMHDDSVRALYDLLREHFEGGSK